MNICEMNDSGVTDRLTEWWRGDTDRRVQNESHLCALAVEALMSPRPAVATIY